MVDAHLLLSLAALGAEASNHLAFLTPILALSLWEELAEALGGLRLQFVGQVMEGACTVLHRLQEMKGEDINHTVHLHITVFTNSTLKVMVVV